MKPPVDPSEIEDVKQQHDPLRQRRQGEIPDVGRRIDHKELAELMYHIPDTNSYREAMESDEAEQSILAMEEGMKVLEDRGVGEEPNQPINPKVLKGQWVH